MIVNVKLSKTFDPLVCVQIRETHFHCRKFRVYLQCQGEEHVSPLQELSPKGHLQELLQGLTESLLQGRYFGVRCRNCTKHCRLRAIHKQLCHLLHSLFSHQASTTATWGLRLTQWTTTLFPFLKLHLIVNKHYVCIDHDKKNCHMSHLNYLLFVFNKGWNGFPNHCIQSLFMVYSVLTSLQL